MKDNIFGQKFIENQLDHQQPNILLMYQELKIKFKQQEARVRILKKVITEQEETIQELKSEHDELKNRISELQDKCSRQKAKKKILNDKIDLLENEINQIRDNQDLNDGEQESEGSDRQIILPNYSLSLLEYIQLRTQQHQWLMEHNSQYQNQEVDTDGMTYEELLALEEEMGNVRRGLTSSEIKTIPKQIIQESENHDRCTVCLNEYQVDDKYRQLECNHMYHSKCIKQWLKNERTCPLCKAEVQIKEPSDHDQEMYQDDSDIV